MARVYPHMIERLESLRQVLDLMVEEKVIWSKVEVCKKIDAPRHFLNPSSTGSSREGIAMYNKACRKLQTVAPNIYPCSNERLKALKKVLDRMVESGVIWTKAKVCKEVGITPAFLSGVNSNNAWPSAEKARLMYQEACEKIKGEPSTPKPVEQSQVLINGQIIYLRGQLKDLSAYNLRLRQVCEQLKAENARLRAELEQLKFEDQKAS